MSEIPPWLHEEGLQQLFAATRHAGGEARAVGGCVRDFLMGRDSSDIDIASTLTPEQTIAMAAQHGWKAVPTGIAHGTVTLVLADRDRIVQVTTLRRDVATDGRHATVAFTDDWQEDAARRDFTFNALYMDGTGHITDFFHGREDLAAHRVRFIGDAATRIAEDALRMLRYFRFLASHAKPPADEEALAAITAATDKIAGLSGERIAIEMRKLLQVENPAFALRLMQSCGAAPFVFSRAITPARMIRLHMLEVQAAYQTSVWARVVVLLEATPQDATWIADRWKLSRHEADQLKLLTSLPPFVASSPKHLHTRLLRLHGAPAYLDWLLLHAALQPGIDTAPYVALAHGFVAPVFPVSARDLMAKGMAEGKALGATLARLERLWEESDYELSREALLQASE